MQNLSNILPLFCTPTWPSHHVSENQEFTSSCARLFTYHVNVCPGFLVFGVSLLTISYVVQYMEGMFVLNRWFESNALKITFNGFFSSHVQEGFFKFKFGPLKYMTSSSWISNQKIASNTLIKAVFPRSFSLFFLFIVHHTHSRIQRFLWRPLFISLYDVLLGW